LSVLLAPPPIYGSLDISMPQVEQIVSQMRMMFDWVIVDLGALLDESGYAFLDSADYIVITVLPELVCLRNTRLMLDQFLARGYPEDRIWIVLNRAGINGGVTREDIETRLHVRVRHTVPDDQPLVSLSVNRGVPLFLSHRRSAMARAIEEFAALFVAGTAKRTTPAETAAEAPAPNANPFRRAIHKSGMGGRSPNGGLFFWVRPLGKRGNGRSTGRNRRERGEEGRLRRKWRQPGVW
jgi:pilus assembly protein CpaE